VLKRVSVLHSHSACTAISQTMASSHLRHLLTHCWACCPCSSPNVWPLVSGATDRRWSNKSTSRTVDDTGKSSLSEPEPGSVQNKSQFHLRFNTKIPSERFPDAVLMMRRYNLKILPMTLYNHSSADLLLTLRQCQSTFLPPIFRQTKY